LNGVADPDDPTTVFFYLVKAGDGIGVSAE
jgi:hypothetical protein